MAHIRYSHIQFKSWFYWGLFNLIYYFLFTQTINQHFQHSKNTTPQVEQQNGKLHTFQGWVFFFPTPFQTLLTLSTTVPFWSGNPFVLSDVMQPVTLVCVKQQAYSSCQRLPAHGGENNISLSFGEKKAKINQVRLLCWQPNRSCAPEPLGTKDTSLLTFHFLFIFLFLS